MVMGRPRGPWIVGSSSILPRVMTSKERDMDRRAKDERDRAIGLLRSADSFLLTGHQRPDGDCIGAQAALSCVLRACGKTVRILNPDPPEPRYHYLSNEVDYGVWQEEQELPAHDVCVLLDCSELSRCGELGKALALAGSSKLVIDHHPHEGEPWWSEAYRDTRAAASGLLVYRIADELGVPLDELAREAVFTSMVTDTGWFRYSNTDPETLRVAASLVEAGLDQAGGNAQCLGVGVAVTKPAGVGNHRGEDSLAGELVQGHAQLVGDAVDEQPTGRGASIPIGLTPPGLTLMRVVVDHELR